jgi:hypothetical protein
VHAAGSGGREAPCRLVVVETEAKEDERQGEKCEAGPSEQCAGKQSPHTGNGGLRQRGCSRLLLLLHAPLLQQPDRLPHSADAHNRHALLLAEHSDTHAQPGSKHAGPAGAGGGGDGQEEEQSAEEEDCWGGAGLGN